MKVEIPPTGTAVAVRRNTEKTVPNIEADVKRRAGTKVTVIVNVVVKLLTSVQMMLRSWPMI